MKAPSSRRHYAFRVLHSALTFAVAAATANAFGATIPLATADAAPAATTSFNSAGGWADGNAPSAGNDYVVALGDASVDWPALVARAELIPETVRLALEGRQIQPLLLH